MIKLILPRLVRYLFVSAGLLVLAMAGFVFWGSPHVLVYSADFEGAGDQDLDASSYFFDKSDKSLALSASSYLVVDLESNETIINKNEEKVLPIASLTKLMTAIVAEDLLPSDEIITISRSAYDTYGNTGNLSVGERISVKDLLYPLLLSSSNDAAEAFAEAVGRNKFLAEMNQRAKFLGLTETFFADPSGLSPANTATAKDLTKLIDYLYKSRPEILAITREKQYRLGRHTWRNLNDISLMSNYIGGKNGYTEEANRTLVSIFQVPITSSSSANNGAVEKRSRLLALVLLQSSDCKNDTRGLINYLTHYVSYLGGKNGFVPIKNI